MAEPGSAHLNSEGGSIITVDLLVITKTRKVKVGYSPTANQIEADLAALLANL